MTTPQTIQPPSKPGGKRHFRPLSGFIDFSAKSCFSFLCGASHPQEMVQQASALGYNGLAITDNNGFSGLVRAHTAAQKLSFKLIMGTEISLESGRVILIAKNLTGYQQICRTLSQEFLKDKKNPQFKISHLEPLSHENVALLFPPRDFVTEEEFKGIGEILPPYQLITNFLNPKHALELKKWLNKIPSSIPKLWTWDSHFHEESRHELYEIMQAIRTNQPLSKLLPSPNGERFLKPLSALSYYKVPEKWLMTAQALGEECTFSAAELRYTYPKEWLPPGKSPEEFLRELCFVGIEKLFQDGAASSIQQQLEHELTLIKKLKFEDYFLTVWDIVHFARSQNILCQGRGSAANSIVCYLLGITSINPIQMNLLFERFISEERNEAPDIDIDFEHERREEVIQYIYKKYGRHRAGMVATLITYRTKSALRDCGKALEIPTETIDRYSRGASWRENVFEWKDSQDSRVSRWLRLAQQLKGFPRHLGQHTGGMILTQGRLDELSPLQAASMENRTCVQWDKYDIENLGLLKIDILGLGMLSALRKAFELVQSSRHLNLSLHSLPTEDEKTYDLIQKAKTVGVFQIESRAQMSMLPRLRPRNFYDLVIEVGIVRPGPIQGGMVHPYLRRRLGLEKVTYADPKLRPILEKTLGIPLFQEQVMKMAIEVAGYTPGEADELRRSMGAWKKTGNLEHHAQDLSRRLKIKGIPSSFADQICKQILGFGEYGFPESHAASFALLTYASAYMKAHYPDAFLCGLLNSMPLGFYPFHMLTFEFQREGGCVLPVDLDRSQWDHTLERIPSNAGTDSSTTSATREEKFGVRLGFRCVKNIQRNHVETFIKAREKGASSLMIFDTQERASLAMVQSIDQKRMAYWNALKPTEDSLLKSTSHSINQCPHEKLKRTLFSPISPFEGMLLDFKFFNTTLETHPTLLSKKERWPFSIPTSRLTLAEEIKNQKEVLVFGMVQIIQSPPTAHGMFFITLEDETGYINIVLTPPIFERYKNLLQSQWALLVRGKVQNEAGAISVLVTQVISPQQHRSIETIYRRSSHPREHVRLSDAHIALFN